MKKKFCEVVEKSRETVDPTFGSPPGSRYGAFFFRCPLTAQKLKVIVCAAEEYEHQCLPGEPWDHVSVSTPNRTPTWEEMCWFKELLFDAEECVVQFHPPQSVYINQHAFVLHLWKPLRLEIPMPPEHCV